MMKRKPRYAEKDFLPSALPKTRKEQFSDILKNRWRTLLLIGVLLFVSSIPLFFLIFYKDVHALGIIANVEEESEQKGQLFLNQMFFGAFYPLGMALIALVLSGAIRIYRNFVFSEGVYFWKDFLYGIKTSGGFYVLSTLLMGYLYLLAIASLYLIQVPFLSYLPLAVYLLFLLPVYLIALEEATLYKNSFIRYWVNGVSLLLYGNWKFYLGYLIAFLPFFFLPTNVLPLLGKYILYALSFLLYQPLAILFFTLLSYDIFDQGINKEKHSEIFKKGLNHLEDTIGPKDD